MSGTPVASAATPAPAEPLDRVMLAMDVVDTLRAQKALVEAELADDERQSAFVARVRQVYESQGIDVPAAVVEEAVQALREQRFAYAPPPRSFAVRLAELYVERGKWALRGLVAAAVAVAIWAAFALPRHYEVRAREQAFAQRIARVDAQRASFATRLTELQGRLERLRGREAMPGVARLCSAVDDHLLAARTTLDALGTQAGERPTAAEFAQDRDRFEPWLGALEDRVGTADRGLSGAASLLDAVAGLQSLRGRLDTVMARLDGVTLTANGMVAIDGIKAEVLAALTAGETEAGARALRRLDAAIDDVLAARRQQAELRSQLANLAAALPGVTVDEAPKATLAELRTGAEQAMAADDWARAEDLVRQLRELVARLDLAYELRIVSRPGERSGVWGHHGNSTERSYYVVVEAVGADGRVLPLPITSEEDQVTRVVRKFAVRVPQQVYEQVKADKQDNGILDHPVFGKKRRGALQDEYAMPVAGGAITRWDDA